MVPGSSPGGPIFKNNFGKKRSGHDYLLAAAVVNQANGLLNLQVVDAALRARVLANQALNLTDNTKLQDEAVAKVNLKACQVLCRAIAAVLAEKDEDSLSRKELVGEATDAVENGLDLAAEIS